ncbi:carbamoyltransferase HypF [Marinobacter caseinilyticus]|uniref:carbamoyltransferase HypF n=1 Tax=Marinobacter caseinilyticus TaxID=2692195 RepID=UPI001F310623|nr:carbamoyltransferase HypF [Marinobacter caseinilyticus]
MTIMAFDSNTDSQRIAELAMAPGSTIRVRGLVQGVGFRPTVWRLAHACGLSGDVGNDAEGVLIHIWGSPSAQRTFIDRLCTETPPLARIEAMEHSPLEGKAQRPGFHIVTSIPGAVRTHVPPDTASCPDCVAEVFDPRNRRFGYAFNNCTHCGPRLSIVHRIPYDRTNTSMTDFALCPACLVEYNDPANRRFHAQPVACPDCGPHLWLEITTGAAIDISAISGDAIAAAQCLLKAGHIIAVKGMGGIHLACDSRNDTAVSRLRERKRRHHKPFAVMAGHVEMVRRYCRVNDNETQLLEDPAAPIVLLEASGAERLAHAVAPGQRCHGVMLPYSPLHHLLMAKLDAPIVLTSANRSGEPQCIGNDEARTQLADIADVLLLNNRDIVNRLDDSVIRLVAERPVVLRRGRGLAPAPLMLPAGFRGAPDILAFGGESKNTFTLLRDGEAIVSQYLGDLANAKAHQAYCKGLALYTELLDHWPQRLAIDRHYGYRSSQLGREWADSNHLPLTEVQHHHAHIAACLVDNGIEPDAAPVLGIVLDGSGYGDDGTLWGGEFLLADYRSARRIATFTPVAMPGGEQAVHQPWRMAYAHLRRLLGWQTLKARYCGLPFFQALASHPVAMLDRMMTAGFNCPMTSSCGRLFDAVAAVTQGRQTVSYEGQAAMELEAIVHRQALHDGHAYPFTLNTTGPLPLLEPAPMWRALLRDLDAGITAGVIAARFHAGLAQALATMVGVLVTRHRDAWSCRIALSGGVFQNAVLSAELVNTLESRGLQVLRHRRAPPNDGGLSLGQAAVAAAQAMAETKRAPPCV